MTIIYTPEQVTAAENVIHTDSDLANYFNREPLGDSAKWNRWNDGYQAAFDAYETAALIYRRLVGTIDPHTVTAAAPSNPLRPSIVPENGTVETDDGHFLAGPFFQAQVTGPWCVDLYDPPLRGPAPLLVATVNTHGRDQAQQIVDLVSWALGAGARLADVDAA